jgi:nucleoside-diphosphate-sugar epimerase
MATMSDESASWRNTKVIVTGATGFIGAHLVRSLIERGADVIATSRRDVGEGDDAGARWVRIDPTDLEQVRGAFTASRPDYVFHLSSLADGRHDLNLVVPIMQAELVSTVNVLTVAAECGIRRLVVPGSLEEPDPGTVPSSPYAAAKAASRIYARMFHLLYALPVVTARIFMTYGPGQPRWKLIPTVARALLSSVPPQIGSPERPVDWIYISDVVEGLVRLAEAPGIEGQTVDLGNGVLTTVRAVVETLCDLCQSKVDPVFAAAPTRPFERVARADLDATVRALHWRPQVVLREGLARTLEAFQRDEGPK